MISLKIDTLFVCLSKIKARRTKNGPKNNPFKELTSLDFLEFLHGSKRPCFGRKFVYWAKLGGNKKEPPYH